MKKCDYCDGLGTVNAPSEKFTNEQGWTECYRHKNMQDCVRQFKLELSQPHFSWAFRYFNKWLYLTAVKLWRTVAQMQWK